MKKIRAYNPIEAALTDRLELVEFFTTEDLNKAAQKTRSEKQPGSDGIPPEIVKLVINEFPEYFLEQLNTLRLTNELQERFDLSSC